MSHEFNSPLNVILNGFDCIMKGGFEVFFAGIRYEKTIVFTVSNIGLLLVDISDL